jgi:hypothetical protein
MLLRALGFGSVTVVERDSGKAFVEKVRTLQCGSIIRRPTDVLRISVTTASEGYDRHGNTVPRVPGMPST